MNPEIVSYKWGEIKVQTINDDGFITNKIYKDCKLYPGGSCEWDWSKTDTHHKPGIQFADIDDLIKENNTAVILLTRGMECIHPQK
jgi:hypothetical protein